MAPFTPQQAIRDAVEAERKAAEFYDLLAEGARDPEAKAFLAAMARAEVEHAESILALGTRLAGDLPARPAGDVELVETLPEWRFAEGLSLDQALRVALDAEHQAAIYYDAIADLLPAPFDAFFRDLAGVEEQHARAIEARAAGR